MSKKVNHIADPLTQRQAEREKAFALLRSTSFTKNVRRLKKANKKSIR